jgi:hypothetical protein
MILTLKLLMTPVLIAAITLAGRRWGQGVSGWLVGFPLVSGPISIVLALQNGAAFATQAAIGTLGGETSVCAYCLAYCLVAQVAGWPASIAVAALAFFATTFLWSLATPSLLLTLAIDAIAIIIFFRIVPRQPAVAAAAIPPKWDIPVRMLLAAAFVLALTSASSHIGAQLSGLISPFPVFSTIMAPFTHHQQGGRAAIHLLRGVVLGSFALLAFYLVVATILPVANILWTYLAASLLAMVVNGVSLGFVRQKAALPAD